LLKTYKSKIIIIGKNRSQEDASNKLEKGPLRDYKTALYTIYSRENYEKIIDE
jgi:hypothetical protein